MSFEPLDLATARRILDFSGGNKALSNLGEVQLEGAVALHNMIVDSKVGMGYLADEVGMGKTYVALGVVSLLRYFNPSLRVLYICPSNNVQEKWFSREYRGFSKNNVRVNQFRIRTVDGKPAVPYANCRNIPDLIRTASLGYFADIFVGMSSFSFALSEDKEQWRTKLNELKKLLPAYEMPSYVESKKFVKQSVKDEYAAALNYILPTFDLVIIDEAHNFKHDFESSHRNRVLSAVLGFREDGNYIKRAKHALLLSATPYDRNINHLRNQLKLVGHGDLLPDDIADDERERIESHLSKFLVRRLNRLQIAGNTYTRNMYRREWRQGDQAEITLQSDEQKLVTALVQKKVGEMLDKKGANPSFQMGLLASFESYAESTRSAAVEFDGDQSEKSGSDAKDRHVIGAISDSFIRSGLGRTLPHPKMDIVTQRLAKAIFEGGRKQIVFVRRVKSVKELKNKLDDHYTMWLAAYIGQQLTGYPIAQGVMNNVVEEYLQQSRYRDEDISGGEFLAGKAGEAEDKQPPKNDTLFAWFFRGEPPETAVPLLTAYEDNFTTPEAMRSGLSAKNQITSALLEINWATTLTRRLGSDLNIILKEHGDDIARRASQFTVGTTQNDQLEIFEASQLGFLQWYAEKREVPGLLKLVNHLAPRVPVVRAVTISVQRLDDALNTYTLFCALEAAGIQRLLFPRIEEVLTQAIEEKLEVEALQTLDIHKSLVSLCLRTGHGVIDLYLARMRQGMANLTALTRAAWMDDIAKQLTSQSESESFSTYQELHSLAQQLDLIIKNNLPDIYDRSQNEYRKHLSQMLNPVAPIIGASGETVSSRSAQARKFRMPGYPLALISTDVFQEGEDLHTFCDSVMHYGLSGSPVSIEQKTGRVDRVGSKAQRRLLSLSDGDDVTDEKLIQVSFPFVRESIEILQVRQLCHNINAFIESLHNVGSEKIDIQDVINTEQAFKDRSAIPEQIRRPLASPYVPSVTEKSPKLNREKYIDEQGAHTDRILRHIEKILKERFGRPVLGAEGLHLPYPDGSEKPITISLRSARASGEILLCAEVSDTAINLAEMDLRQLRNQMLVRSWNTFHRTYAVETAISQFQLYHDAELLIGDAHSTTASEVDRFFERFTQQHNPSDYQKPTSTQTLNYWSHAAVKNSADFGQWTAEVTDFEYDDCLGLTFTFGDKGWTRTHYIKIFETQGRCIFLAQAATPEIVKDLNNVDQLVKLTWQRNKHIDIVEFMLDEDSALMGRAIHPIEGMTYKEFLYCAYTLAVSTDRLEFLIHQPDVH